MQIEKYITQYQIQYEDITNNIFLGTTFTLDASILNLRRLFRKTEIKIYNEIIFIDGK